MNILSFDLDFNRLADVLTYDPKAPMIFSSGVFLWLFLGFIIIYYALKKRDTARILFVTAFSYYFYYKSSGIYFFLLGIVTCADFFLAKCIVEHKLVKERKIYVVLSLMINLGLLVYFKYTNFFGDIIA